jgi:hypothetical protein
VQTILALYPLYLSFDFRDLCLQEERRVGNDNTVKWLQIPPSPLRPHFVRATVRIHEYPDGRLAIFHGPHGLAEYDPHGNLHEAPNWLREPLRQPPCGFVDNAARCLDIGARSYGSIQSILKHGLDRQPPRPAAQTELLPDHPNIRGPRYYH